MRLVLTLLWLTLAALCGSSGALAHAALVESAPMDGAVLRQAPSTVHLRFNEPVSLLVVSLTDAKGRTHRHLTVTAHDATLAIAVPPDLPQGSQILSYRVTSGDGHPISGSLIFSIGTSSEPGTRPAASGEAPVQPLLWLARISLYLSLFVGAGGSFFLAWVAPGFPLGKIRWALTAVLGLGAIAAVLSLGLQGVDALGTSLAALEDPHTWATGWRTSFGPTVAAACAALFFTWLSLRAPVAWQNRCGSLVALAGVGLSLALSGHASSAQPQWITRPAVFLHAVGVAYWIGALFPLVFVIRQAPAQAFPVVRRFSTGALAAVAALTVAGLILAAVQVETPTNLIGTSYGRILLIKTALVAGLLGLAAVNRRWLTLGLARLDGSGGKWLIRSVAAELVLATAILALVGVWRFTPPPRSLSAAAAAPASVHLHTPNLMAQVTLSPGSVGATRARIMVASGGSEPVNPKEVTLIVVKPDAGIEPLERQARKGGRNAWEVDGLVLPVAGTWQVKIGILVNDFEKADLEGDITLRP
ncbi:copper resistance CopC/CopD family protein [Microvirga sp. CF3016]|uniref:copper resistance CopC/CopD family protein n=1 Tax=Microvirga sp. CF3016 TaxID=3110181 RepID=UPI002E7A3939|nr:CopD family protein [Microvirga sp. CF3016]MEE1609873.1 CopD family protein [Microvirga sp. CF3016]